MMILMETLTFLSLSNLVLQYYNLYRSCLLIYGIAIVTSLSLHRYRYIAAVEQDFYAWTILAS